MESGQEACMRRISSQRSYVGSGHSRCTGAGKAPTQIVQKLKFRAILLHRSLSGREDDYDENHLHR